MLEGSAGFALPDRELRRVGRVGVPGLRCPNPPPRGVRDAGLALMSVGAAAVLVGLSLRWADQRRQRKLRTAPTPTVGPGAVGLGWRGQF
jgi:hypothetical protein